MKESWKSLFVLLLVVSSFAAGIMWIDDRPNGVVWTARIVSTFLVVGSLVALLMPLRPDIAPDFLASVNKSYFECDGLAFAFVAPLSDCALSVYFQNQYDRLCIGRIAIRPARGFWLTRAPLRPIEWKIECAPAAFGMAQATLSIPRELLGTSQNFEVGASADYPDGRGNRVRFNQGTFVRPNERFEDPVGKSLAVAGVLTGVLASNSPAKVTIDLPFDAVVSRLDREDRKTITLWQLGEPPLDLNAFAA